MHQTGKAPHNNETPPTDFCSACGVFCSFYADVHVICPCVVRKSVSYPVICVRVIEEFHRNALCFFKLKRRVDRHDERDDGLDYLGLVGRLKADSELYNAVSVFVRNEAVARFKEQHSADERASVFHDAAPDAVTVGGNELRAVLGKAVVEHITVALRELIGREQKLAIFAKRAQLLELGIELCAAHRAFLPQPHGGRGVVRLVELPFAGRVPQGFALGLAAVGAGLGLGAGRSDPIVLVRIGQTLDDHDERNEKPQCDKQTDEHLFAELLELCGLAARLMIFRPALGTKALPLAQRLAAFRADCV